MNAATTTGAVAVSAAMLASIITWLAGLAHVAMPEQVAGALAALILYGGHTLSAWLSGHPIESPPAASQPPAPKS
ncbi:MAG: hypothetical protein ACYC97_13420 [Metallibacterium sp.]